MVPVINFRIPVVRKDGSLSLQPGILSVSTEYENNKQIRLRQQLESLIRKNYRERKKKEEIRIKSDLAKQRIKEERPKMKRELKAQLDKREERFKQELTDLGGPLSSTNNSDPPINSWDALKIARIYNNDPDSLIKYLGQLSEDKNIEDNSVKIELARNIIHNLDSNYSVGKLSLTQEKNLLTNSIQLKFFQQAIKRLNDYISYQDSKLKTSEVNSDIDLENAPEIFKNEKEEILKVLRPYIYMANDNIHQFIEQSFKQNVPSKTALMTLFNKREDLQAAIIEREARAVASLLSSLPEESQSYKNIKANFEELYDSIVDHGKKYGLSAQMIKVLNDLSSTHIPGTALHEKLIDKDKITKDTDFFIDQYLSKNNRLENPDSIKDEISLDQLIKELKALQEVALPRHANIMRDEFELKSSSQDLNKKILSFFANLSPKLLSNRYSGNLWSELSQREIKRGIIDARKKLLSSSL